MQNNKCASFSFATYVWDVMEFLISFNDEVQTQEFHSMQFCVSFGPEEDHILQPIHQHKEIYYQY